MITHLTGQLVEKKPPIIIIDVNGIGYEIHAPMSTFYSLPDINNRITLLTHLSIREDAHVLFGFFSERERQLFRALIKVNGVGPKLALTILSGMEIDLFIQCIQADDIQSLTKIPGVGKKTAERLMIEMQDSLSKWNISIQTTFESSLLNNPNQTMEEAIQALIALGFKPNEAKSAITKVHEPHHNHEQLIRLALQKMIKPLRI